MSSSRAKGLIIQLFFPGVMFQALCLVILPAWEYAILLFQIAKHETSSIPGFTLPQFTTSITTERFINKIRHWYLCFRTNFVKVVLTRCRKHFYARDVLGIVRNNPILQSLVYSLVLKKFWGLFHEALLICNWKQNMYQCNDSYLQTR